MYSNDLMFLRLEEAKIFFRNFKFICIVQINILRASIIRLVDLKMSIYIQYFASYSVTKTLFFITCKEISTASQKFKLVSE